MATTTNYSWTTPDDTSLVKDGAAAIRTLGSAIDTTVFNNASAAIAKSIVDAKGDLIAATGADTVSRLAVGSNNQVLTADSSTATGLKWDTPASESMTLLSTTTLSGADTTISSINQTYKKLYITVQNVTVDAAFFLNMVANATSNFTYVRTYLSAANTSATVGTQGNLWRLAGSTVPSCLATGGNNSWSIEIDDYTNTTSYKTASFVGGFRDSGDTFDVAIGSSAIIESNNAITSITFSHNQTTFNAGTVKIYGVK